MEISRPSAKAASPRQVMILAGEASGDLHGANLVQAVQRLDPSVEFAGIGGGRMERSGVRLLLHASEMAVVGLTEVFRRAGTVMRAARSVKRFLCTERPGLLILIDYPEFNIHIAATAKKHGIPVLYYISPQVWAWRKGRIRKIWRRIDRMAVILPFEEAFYRAHGVRVEYVGHPLLDNVPADLPRRPASVEWQVGDASPLVGLVPGSREEEVHRMLPVMVRAAETLKRRFSGLECLLPLAPGLKEEEVRALIGGSPVPVRILSGNLIELLSRCHTAMVTSGTATLEAALAGVPMVVVYRVSPLTYWAGRLLIHVPFISLVNLVAGKKVVTELIQDDAVPERLSWEIRRLLEDEDSRNAMMRELHGVRLRLGEGGASERAARMVLGMLKNPRD